VRKGEGRKIIIRGKGEKLKEGRGVEKKRGGEEGKMG